jgi:hypothetical protein
MDVMTYDIGVEMAVAAINSEEHILPGVLLEVVKFNTWDPQIKYQKSDMFYSGGYAATETHHQITLTNNANISNSTSPPIVMAMGELLDSTTIHSESLYSYYSIPFCGAMQQSTLYSDPNMFQINCKIDIMAVVNIVKKFGLNRLSIISGMDEGSIESSKLLVAQLRESGLQVNIYRANSYSLRFIFDNIKQIDMRYFFLYFIYRYVLIF